MKASRFVLAAVASGGLACNALTGVGDLAIGDQACAEACDDASVTGDSPIDPGRDATVDLDDASVDDTGTGDAEAAVDADAGVDAPLKPSYCTGITMYLPFEDSVATKDGQTTDPAIANPTFVAGKYGKAIDLTGAVTYLYYASSFGAVSRYNVALGSVAMWVKAPWSPPCTGGRTLFKPHGTKGASTPTAGAMLNCGQIYGLAESVIFADGGGVTTGPNAAGNGSWGANNWNLLVGTWEQGTPRLTLSVNGQARATAPEPWTPGESPVNWLKIGSEVTEPNAIVDEVVVWNRALSVAESTAVYSATQSIGQVCGL